MRQEKLRVRLPGWMSDIAIISHETAHVHLKFEHSYAHNSVKTLSFVQVVVKND